MPDEIEADCPHRQQLEYTLRHCQNQTEVLKATRDNYLSIIDEFKQDLDELTEQVEQQCQPPTPTPTPTPTESEQSSEEPHVEITRIAVVHAHLDGKLELQNERLVDQIECMKETLQDRDKQITQLNSMINGYSDFCENKRLKEEIYELKQKNCGQSRKVREMAALLKSQEDGRLELCSKYEALVDNFEVQCKDLKRANRRVQCLQDRLSEVEKMQDEFRIERNLLREEVIALKEKDACSTGRERSLCDQLKSTQLELDKSRLLIRDMQCYLAKQKSQHLDAVEQLQCANEEIGQQLRDLVVECKQMQLKLKQQTDVNHQQQQIIDSFRKWKDAQVRSDEAMRQCVKRAEEHINMLLEENQRLCEEYRRMHRDYCVLETEMQRVKNCVNNPSSETTLQQGAGAAPGNDMTKRLQFLCNTSRRISDQCQTLSANDLPPNQLWQRRGGGSETPAYNRLDYSQLRATQSSDSLLYE